MAKVNLGLFFGYCSGLMPHGIVTIEGTTSRQTIATHHEIVSFSLQVGCAK